jgi:DHA1 family inner membrane transport protein
MGNAARKPLLALALAAFGIGTTEFVVMGLLPDVATNLGVSIPAAGLLVSGYALGVALGGPLLAVALARAQGKPALICLMALFIAGNVGCALAPAYGWLMAARVLTAFCHAAFFGIGAVIAADLAAPDKRAQAIAMMISGLTLANVLGVPLGTMIGQVAGWRATFWVVAAIGIAALATLAAWLPSETKREARNLRREWATLLQPSVLRTLAISVIASISMFIFFTYITPILTQVSGVRASNVGWVLLACGIGLTGGNVVGARLADWRALPSLGGILALTTSALLVFAWAGRHPLPATVLMVLWGAVAFAVCAILQAEIVYRARVAPNLASTLNISAFNLGNAIGAALGGLALERGIALDKLPLLAAGAAFVALTLTVFAMLRDRTSDPSSATK